MDRFVEEFSPGKSDVVICGSMTHKKQWLEIAKELQDSGLIVATPDLGDDVDWAKMTDAEIRTRRSRLIRGHAAKIATTEAVLVCNYQKNDVVDYIGSSTFLEMGIGFTYGKVLYILNDTPQQDSREEILALEPIVLHGDLNILIEEVKK